MRKRHNKSKGQAGENIAQSFVIHKGWEILARNYKTELGEIDIIAWDKGTLVFIEVKLRKDDAFGYGAEAVGFGKIKKINQVASQYIRQHCLYQNAVRFDVIEIYADEKKINYIPDAFESYLSY